tara:strand:- start:351 stop:461 length:111 start_codon:yes stop_codon:yes gene_type:complete
MNIIRKNTETYQEEEDLKRQHYWHRTMEGVGGYICI